MFAFVSKEEIIEFEMFKTDCELQLFISVSKFCIFIIDSNDLQYG